jgi:glutathione S-transferase
MPVITIYHVPGTRSVRPIWLCEELGIDYKKEVISFDASFRASPEWRRLNPVGKVPVMTDGDLTMFESCAMVQVILDRYGEGRLEPQRGSNDHALMQQWSWFSESTLARPAGEIVNHRRVFGDKHIPEVMAEMADRIRLCLTAVDQAVTGRDFLVDYGFCAADINLGYSLHLARGHVPLDDYPNARAYFERLAARPGFKNALT